MRSLVGEIDALKPGNVHRYAPGHGMRYEDFLTSARVVTPILCDDRRGLGKRCLDAVAATRQAVGVNTNLGIVLLFAPLICAAQQCRRQEELRGALVKGIAAAQHDDVSAIFQAIAMANPGGLGVSERHDVRQVPACSLLEAMGEAAPRDRIAAQFLSAGADIFEVGWPVLRRYAPGDNGVEWATVECYLRLLASFPDSHVQRKHGPGVARTVSQRARQMLVELEQERDPGNKTSRLLGLDREWKEAGINPGTSADLTAASLLLYHLHTGAET